METLLKKYGTLCLIATLLVACKYANIQQQKEVVEKKDTVVENERTAENQQVMLIVCFGRDFPGREAFLDAIATEFPSISSLYYIINAKVNDSVADQECILYKGDEAIYESMHLQGKNPEGFITH